MAHRSIGQEPFGFATGSRGASSLDELDGLLDWKPIAVLLDPLYRATKGKPAWPPLAMFKALLLPVWHDLSDVKLAEALGDRASFRRFCGFSRNEATPERTAFVRYCRSLVAQGLDGPLFEAVTTQLKARAITVKTGTLIDATVIVSASEGDADGRWVKHKGKPPVHGFKAHVGTDSTSALVEKVSITPANVNDGRAGPDALPDDPEEVFADSAYHGPHFGGAVRARGGIRRVIATGMRGCDVDETHARLDAWNQLIHHIRARIEKIFGIRTRSYGLRRMRWRGLAKAAVQVHLTAIATNLKRTRSILMAAA
jgi:IS5 family transposase